MSQPTDNTNQNQNQTQNQQSNSNPVVVQAPSQDQNAFFRQMTETMGTMANTIAELPEKVIDGFREATQNQQPAQNQQQQQQQSTQGAQLGLGEPATSTPQATPSNVPQSQQTGGNEGGKKSFADWWFGR